MKVRFKEILKWTFVLIVIALLVYIVLKFSITLTEVAQLSEIIVGIGVIISIWLSIKTLKQTQWHTAMTTAPSIVIRPESTFVGLREKGTVGYRIIESGHIIQPGDHIEEIIFAIYFECINKGRGTAFNISKPHTQGMYIESEWMHVPSQQFLEDNPFSFRPILSRNYVDWVLNTKRFPSRNVEVFITYNNDQGNIYCKSIWSGEIMPFHIENGKLVVKMEMIKNMSSKILYSQKSF